MALDPQRTGHRILLTLARQGLGSVLRLAFVALAARALGPAGNGQYALAMLVPTLLTATLHFGVPAANVYFVASGGLDLTRAFWLNVRVWTHLVGAGAAIVAACTILSNDLIPGATPESIALASLVFPVTLAASFLSGLVQSRKDFGSFNRALAIAPVVSLVLLGAVWLGRGRIEVRDLLLIQLSSEVVATAYFWRALSPHLGGQSSNGPSIGLAALLRYGGIMQVGSVLMQLSYRLDLFLVNFYLGSAAAGVYYIGVRIAEQVWMASQATSSVLMPDLSARDSNQPNAPVVLAGMAVRLVLYPGIALGLALMLVAPVLIRMLFGSAYEEAARLVSWLLPGALLLNAARLACVAMAARGKPELTLIVNVTVFVLNLGLNLWLIPRLQLTGAALATSLSYTAGTTAALSLLARSHGESVRRLLTPTAHDLAAFRSVLLRRDRRASLE